MTFYAADVFNGFGITQNEVSAFRENHIEFNRMDMRRVSEILLIQLVSIQKHHTYNVFSITDVVQDLEGVGRGQKRRIEKFKHHPLKGIRKAHFIDARFLPKNLINHWGLEYEDSGNLNVLYKKILGVAFPQCHGHFR